MAWRSIANARQGLIAPIHQPVSLVRSALMARMEMVTRLALIALLPRDITVQVDPPHLQACLVRCTGLSCAGGADDNVVCPKAGIPLQQGLQNVSSQCWSLVSECFLRALPCWNIPTSNLDCMPRSPGSFTRDTNASVSCITCPAGSFWTEVGSDTSKACVSCPAGLYSSSNSSICSPCPASTSTEQTGATVLTECECKAGFRGPNMSLQSM